MMPTGANGDNCISKGMLLWHFSLFEDVAGSSFHTDHLVIQYIQGSLQRLSVDGL